MFSSRAARFDHRRRADGRDSSAVRSPGAGGESASDRMVGVLLDQAKTPCGRKRSSPTCPRAGPAWSRRRDPVHQRPPPRQADRLRHRRPGTSSAGRRSSSSCAGAATVDPDRRAGGRVPGLPVHPRHPGALRLSGPGAAGALPGARRRPRAVAVPVRRRRQRGARPALRGDRQPGAGTGGAVGLLPAHRHRDGAGAPPRVGDPAALRLARASALAGPPLLRRRHRVRRRSAA